MKKNVLLICLMALTATAASAQTVLTVVDEATEITSVQAGSYDVVKNVWKLEKGKTYYLRMPAHLNGYYFGVDANRYKLTGYSSGDTSIKRDEMSEYEDFMAGEAYCVTPTIDVDTIVHIRPGIKTIVAKTEKGKELMHNNTLPSSVENVEVDDPSQPTPIYDLQGRHVSSIRKGETYIINGKKVSFK